MTDITDKEKLKLEETIEELEEIKGRHTELVTVMIPAGYNISSVVRQLEAEKSTAANIKSKQTRTAVIDSLERIIRELKTYKTTPPNGLALFAGNISEKPGASDIGLWAIEPPKPLNIRMYRCDQTFVVDPLKEMLQTEEIYGLLTIDRQEATIGILEGKKIKILRKLSSGVPGKIRAGGQCLSPNTLIMKDTGEIIEIKDSHNPLTILSENFNKEKTEETPIIAKWENKKELFEIITTYPRLKIKSSKDHTFFLRTKKGIEEKPLSEIKEGEHLLMPEKINLDLKRQKINFKAEIKQKWNMKKVHIPKELDETLSKILGYYLGNGNHEIDRIIFSEQRKELVEYYKKLLENYFKTEAKIRFRENKGYYQLRLESRIIAQFFKSIFKEKSKTLEKKIPSIILRSPDNILTSFISGLFDAEGYVSKSRVALGINNKIIVKQLQFTFLRLGIISSINEYDNRRNPHSNKTRYTITIDDLESLKKFYNEIGFTTKDKQENLKQFIESRSSKNMIRQIAINGKEVAKIIRNSGLNTKQFNAPYFFVNKRQMSKEVFKKKIIDKINNPELKKRLEMFYKSNLIPIKISKIKSLGLSETIDIETKNHNFIANGIIAHNSSQRFHRITEGLAKEFFRRVAQEMKELLFDMPRLKGIMIGGPIPTKEEFLEEGHLVTKLKEKVISVKDIGYVDEHGIELLVEASKDEIAEQEIIKEKKILERFFNTLGKNPKKAIYGEENINTALKRGAVELLLISKKVEKHTLLELEKKAQNIGSEIVLVSMETEEGEQFYNITKGIGAILRFGIE